MTRIALQASAGQGGSLGPKPNDRPSGQPFMLNRPDANVYNRRHRSRLTVTTIDAMTIVAASSAGKFAVSVARLMTAPNPVVVMVCRWKWKYSATILAFHAPRRGTAALEEPRDQTHAPAGTDFLHASIFDRQARVPAPTPVPRDWKADGRVRRPSVAFPWLFAKSSMVSPVELFALTSAPRLIKDLMVSRGMGAGETATIWSRLAPGRAPRSSRVFIRGAWRARPCV